MVTLDFETEAITTAPAWRAPKPVGLAIQIDGQAPKYITGMDAMDAALSEVWHMPMLFHNAPFDLSVATQHFGLPMPPADRVHDTMIQLYLIDPYARSYALKSNAEKYLHLPPDEQNTLHDWILNNVKGATRKTAGAYISLAPVDLVAPYAVGDVTRTRQLFDVTNSQITAMAMLEAYQREMQLQPILMAATRRGVPVNKQALMQDCELYSQALQDCRQEIFSLLGGEINLDSPAQMVARLEALGAVSQWAYTDKGAKSASLKTLKLLPEFAALGDLLRYQGFISTCLSTFFVPWIEGADENNRLHPQWHQTRSDENGTRTGRISCSDPNFTNIPNPSDIVVPAGFPPLPVMRNYVLAPPGKVWLKRDFSAQEMRILAHFAEGRLYEAFNRDPTTDPHVMVQGIIQELFAILLSRKSTKTTGFGIIYGMGIPALSGALNVNSDHARQMREAYYAALPEVKELDEAVKRRARAGLPIRTWGGRLIYKEQGFMRDLGYKLLNYLIQGSGADQTKQAIIDWDATRGPDDELLTQVYDEINIAVPIEDAARGMDCLQMAMDAPRFDVPFLSEGMAGTSWGQLQDFEVWTRAG